MRIIATFYMSEVWYREMQGGRIQPHVDLMRRRSYSSIAAGGFGRRIEIGRGFHWLVPSKVH